MGGLMVIAEKEMKDQFGSKRFLVLFGFTILLSGLAAYQGVDFMGVNPDAQFLHIFTGTRMNFSFIQIMVLFGPMVGMALGFDSINKESMTGTLSVLLGQPIFRDTVINGKFLAGAASLAVVGISNILITVGLAIPLLGYGPSGAETLRIFVLAPLTTSTSMLASIGTWMFFSIILGILASAIAGIVVPLPSGDFKGGRGEMDVKTAEEWKVSLTQRWEFEQSITQISPTTQYQTTATAFLDASNDFALKSGEFARSMPLGEALTANWASIAFLAVGLIVCFAASYMLFLRMEIRPGD
jgi:ABC-2 type transport system permease protein